MCESALQTIQWSIFITFFSNNLEAFAKHCLKTYFPTNAGTFVIVFIFV